uniref:Hypothetical secreted peptide n=1 Tax=Glossina morsitans morsitans TaxID=37546 RepID=D3TSM9_GLOMM
MFSMCLFVFAFHMLLQVEITFNRYFGIIFQMLKQIIRIRLHYTHIEKKLSTRVSEYHFKS